MATQKLQVSKAIKVVPSDTISIPSPMGTAQSGTDATGAASKLTMASTAGVEVGFIVVNTTDNTSATVTAIDSATAVSLSADIMAASDTYTIYSDPAKSNSSCVLYVGVAGDLKVETASGDIVIFTAAPAGYHPVQVVKVFATGTAATDIIALW
jgi:hypothetical protein